MGVAALRTTTVAARCARGHAHLPPYPAPRSTSANGGDEGTNSFPPFPAFLLPKVQRATRTHVTTAHRLAGVDDAAAAVRRCAWSPQVHGTNDLPHKDIVRYTNMKDSKYHICVPTACLPLRSHWRSPWRLALSCTRAFPTCSSTVRTCRC